jgi:predicted ester cyclase
MTIEPNPNLPGFDAEFHNLDQYIRVITDRIWEGGRIDDIYKYYSDPCIVETPSSVSTALEDVVRGTRATLAAFPDRRLLAEDIIQSGDAVGGFLSSHRIISTMTHLGDGAFGQPTGKKIHVRTIADCVCRDNRIIHEWLVRDQAAIALQIGVSPRDIAARWLADSQPIEMKALSDIAHHPDKNSGALTYDDAVHHLGPAGTTRYGQAEVTQYWQQLFTMFNVKKLTIEHLAMQQGNGRADRAALRWRAETEHAGAGAFGVPTHKPVEIMGINHVEFFNGRVLREWVLVDEIALWMQVLAG